MLALKLKSATPATLPTRATASMATVKLAIHRVFIWFLCGCNYPPMVINYWLNR
jgi:hypothetical protein